MNYNKLIIAGRVGQEPEMREFDNSKVMRFSVAVSEYWNDKQGQRQEKTHWINVKAWNKVAELIMKHSGKGLKILLEGKLQVDDYTTKNGDKRKDIYLKADNVQFIDWKDSNSDSSSSFPEPKKAGFQIDEKASNDWSVDEGDLPF